MNDITLKSGKTISLNQAFNIDCLEFMKELPDKCIDLVLTDPPYGINADKMQLGNGKNKIDRGTSNWDNKTPSKEYFNEIFRISKNQVIWGANYFTDKIPPSMGWIFWDKGTGANDFSDGELAFTSFNKALRKYFKSWVGNNAKDNGDISRIHPTQKPKDLFVWCIKNYCKKPHSIIFDPFLGSFTTAISCNEMGIEWIGCEKDPDYFKSGYHRYEQETKQMLMEF